MTLLSLSHTTSQAGSGEARTSGSPTEVAWSILWPSAPPASASKDMRFSSCYSGFAETKPSSIAPPPPNPIPIPTPAHPRGLSDLPAELWQSLLLLLPPSTLWPLRAVHPAWKTFIETHLQRALLQDTRLILQDETCATHFLSGFHACSGIAGEWLVYNLPEGQTHRFRRTTWKRAQDGRHLLLGRSAYVVQVSVGGYLGPVPTARRVTYDSRQRTLRVDWRVLLQEMLGRPGGWAQGMMLWEMMHQPAWEGAVGE